MNVRLLGVTLAGAALILTGCSDGGTTAAERATASPTPTSTPDGTASESTVTTPVDGTWALKQTRADVVRHLQQSGFGYLADRFVRSERIWEHDNWQWEFDDGYFTARWMGPDRAWKAADYGTYEVHGTKLDLQFGETAATTTFAWTASDGELHLDWIDVDSDPMYKGIPDEAYWRAYLTEPLTRAS